MSNVSHCPATNVEMEWIVKKTTKSTTSHLTNLFKCGYVGFRHDFTTVIYRIFFLLLDFFIQSVQLYIVKREKATNYQSDFDFSRSVVVSSTKQSFK